MAINFDDDLKEDLEALQAEEEVSPNFTLTEILSRHQQLERQIDSVTDDTNELKSQITSITQANKKDKALIEKNQRIRKQQAQITQERLKYMGLGTRMPGVYLSAKQNYSNKKYIAALTGFNLSFDQHGVTYGAHFAGEIYFRGLGVEQDFERAAALLELAVSGDYRELAQAQAMLSEAYLQLGKVELFKKNLMLAAKPIRKQAQPTPSAQVLLSIYHHSGTQGFEQDIALASQYAEMALANKSSYKINDQDKAQAHCVLGLIHFHGQGAFKQNISAGLKHLEQAGSLGSSEALYTLGVAYRDGTKEFSSDATKALAYFDQAAGKGHLDAQIAAAKLCDEGASDLKEDKEKAIHYLRQAANQKNLTSMFELAQRLETGEGVEPEPKEAKEWYTLAADLGDESSKLKLQQLVEEASNPLESQAAKPESDVNLQLKQAEEKEALLKLELKNKKEQAVLVQQQLKQLQSQAVVIQDALQKERQLTAHAADENYKKLLQAGNKNERSRLQQYYGFYLKTRSVPQMLLNDPQAPQSNVAPAHKI